MTVLCCGMTIHGFYCVAPWGHNRGNADLPGCHTPGHAPEPMLGLATTRELLEEVAVRMRETQNSIKGRDLGALCWEAIDNLDAHILDYRTAVADG